MTYKLKIRYVYSFYNFDELLDCDVKEDDVTVEPFAKRFTLYLQEDSTFIVSEVKEDFKGKYVIVSYPNKDNVIVYENDETELAYDEFFDAMGGNNHNVYEGTFALEAE
ncbi:MAG: hypothetical protein IJW38_00345 [Clostridia bacterium]|nr:hypothetical protein [Clostridia bacterium]